MKSSSVDFNSLAMEGLCGQPWKLGSGNPLSGMVDGQNPALAGRRFIHPKSGICFEPLEFAEGKGKPPP